MNNQPSDLMKRFARGEAEKYFFIENGTFTDEANKEREMPCKFEVGYFPISGQIIAIYYPNDPTVVWWPFGNNGPYSLKGYPENQEFLISVEGWQRLESRGGAGSNVMVYLVFSASELAISNDESSDHSRIVFNLVGFHGIEVADVQYKQTEFNIKDDLKLILTVIRDWRIVTQPNEVTATIEILSSSYSPHQLVVIAELWNYLLFLTFGQSVEWVSYETYDANNNLLQKTWRRYLHAIRFAPFGGISDTNRWGKFDMSFLRPFVETAMRSILENTDENIEKYVEFLFLYRLYVNATYEETGQVRLICSLTEEMLLFWGKKLANNNPWDEAKEKRKKKLKQLSEGVKSAPNHKDLKNFIGSLRHPSLKEKFEGFFKWYDAPSRHFENRVKQFISTRNRIIHSGKFDNQEPQKQVLEHKNSLMMIPLMIILMIDYRGDYLDFYTGRKMRDKFFMLP